MLIAFAQNIFEISASSHITLENLVHFILIGWRLFVLVWLHAPHNTSWNVLRHFALASLLYFLRVCYYLFGSLCWNTETCLFYGEEESKPIFVLSVWLRVLFRGLDSVRSETAHHHIIIFYFLLSFRWQKPQRRSVRDHLTPNLEYSS